MGFGIHVTPDLSFAQRYAHDLLTARKRKGKQPFVWSGYMRAGRILRADIMAVEGEPEFDLALRLYKKSYVSKDEQGRGCLWLQNSIDSASPRHAESLIRNAGYNCVEYVAKIITLGHRSSTVHAEARSYLVFDPRDLRHQTHDFQPDPGNLSAPRPARKIASPAP